MMLLNIEKWSAFISMPADIVWDTCPCPHIHCHQQGDDWPVPENVPKMQRRRMSHLAKMIFSQLEKMSGLDNIASIFSTRHGDLPTTIKLIEDVASGQDLSPTHFALSVHNAIAGQFGILYQNKQPSSVISAGRDSFHQALIEANARILSGQLERILVVHADMPLPSAYAEFRDEAQVAHCIALVLSAQPTALRCALSWGEQQQTDRAALPQAIQFMQRAASGEQQFVIDGDKSWSWQYA